MLLYTLYVVYYINISCGAAGIQVAVVAGDSNTRLLLEQAKDCPSLKYVISIDRTVPEDVMTMAKERNIELRTFNEVMVSTTWLKGNCIHDVDNYQELGQENPTNHQVSVADTTLLC